MRFKSWQGSRIAWAVPNLSVDEGKGREQSKLDKKTAVRYETAAHQPSRTLVDQAAFLYRSIALYARDKILDFIPKFLSGEGLNNVIAASGFDATLQIRFLGEDRGC